MKRWLAVVVVAGLLSGCMAQWVKVKSADMQHRGSGYDIVLPDNWVKRSTADELVVSRDGPDLQKITVRLVTLDQAFPKLERSADSDMLPNELADQFVANLRKSQADNLPSWKTESIVPALLDGNNGFKVVGSYRTDDGVRYRLIAVGAATEKVFATVVYEAAHIHFFDHSLADFEESLASFDIE